MAPTIGIDIGGSSVRAVARDESGTIVDRYHTTGTRQGGSQVAAAAVDAYRALEGPGCVGVGIGIPGQVDPSTGRVSHAINLGIDRPYDLGAEVAEEVGKSVIVENDVRVAALGARESLALGGTELESLAVLSIGTGIGAGVVVNGSLLRGAQGMAGEIGHVTVDQSGPVCRCGQRGCLEAVAAGPAIGRAWPKGDADAAAAALFAAAADGDPAAQRVADRVTGHIVTALVWLAAAYDTEVIVLAGGVSSVGIDFLSAIYDQIARRAGTSEIAARRLRPEQVMLADHLDPPGPRGAALMAAMHNLQGRVSPAGKTKGSSKPMNKQLGGAV